MSVRTAAALTFPPPDPIMFNPLRTRDTILEEELDSARKEVEERWDAKIVSYFGTIDDEGTATFKAALENIDTSGTRLLLNLETYGGYVESAERMVNNMRHHFDHIEFVVTTFAMSAGTVLAMSGDKIWMDYSSTLGPIDPQIRQPETDRLVPALGYLEHYRRLVESSRDGSLSEAEASYMIQRFDPAELYQYEQARDLSIALIKEWLVKYKLSDWTITKSRQIAVTADMKMKRAEDVAQLLNDTSVWHSHSRGISMEAVREVLRLLVDDIGYNDGDGPISGMRDSLSIYNALLTDQRMRRAHQYLILDSEAGYYGN